MAVRGPVLAVVSGGWDEGAGDLRRSDDRADERDSAAAHRLARIERAGGDRDSALSCRRILRSLPGTPASIHAPVPGNQPVVAGFGPPQPFRAYLVSGPSDRPVG